MRSVALTIAVLCAACARSGAAQGVRVYTQPSQVEGCDDLGSVNAHVSGWGERFKAEAEADAREAAARLGANAIMVRQHDSGFTGHSVIAEAYICAQRGDARPKAPRPSVRKSLPKLGSPTRILVLGLKVIGADQRLGLILSTLLSAEMQKVENLSVVDRADIDSALNLEKQRDLLGCDTTSCLTEIAGALGTNLVLYGTVGTIGSQYAINASLFDSRSSRAIARFSRAVSANEDELVAVMPELAYELAMGMASR